MFPRIAIHTGTSIVATNKHPNWKDTVVIQHNETTATILRYGEKMTAKSRNRHPLLSTFQSICDAPHWMPYQSYTLQECMENDVWDGLLLGQSANEDGKVISATEAPTVGVQPPVEHI